VAREGSRRELRLKAAAHQFVPAPRPSIEGQPLVGGAIFPQTRLRSFLKERLLSRALLEEEHDYCGSRSSLDLIAAARPRQGRVKAGEAAAGKP